MLNKGYFPSGVGVAIPKGMRHLQKVGFRLGVKSQGRRGWLFLLGHMVCYC